MTLESVSEEQVYCPKCKLDNRTVATKVGSAGAGHGTEIPRDGTGRE